MTDEGKPHQFVMVGVHLKGTLTAIELAVFVGLGWHADRKGNCWPSHASVAQAAGVSTRTAQRAIASLVEKGVIQKRQRRNAAGGMTSNFYHVELWERDDD